MNNFRDDRCKSLATDQRRNVFRFTELISDRHQTEDISKSLFLKLDVTSLALVADQLFSPTAKEQKRVERTSTMGNESSYTNSNLLVAVGDKFSNSGLNVVEYV